MSEPYSGIEITALVDAAKKHAFLKRDEFELFDTRWRRLTDIDGCYWLSSTGELLSVYGKGRIRKWSTESNCVGRSTNKITLAMDTYRRSTLMNEYWGNR